MSILIEIGVRAHAKGKTMIFKSGTFTGMLASTTERTVMHNIGGCRPTVTCHTVSFAPAPRL